MHWSTLYLGVHFRLANETENNRELPKEIPVLRDRGLAALGPR